MIYSAYHLKKLVWFRGWTPTHWLLMDTLEGLKARCTYASDAPMSHPISRWEGTVPDEMLLKIERSLPGSLPALMGFEFLLCDGEPGSTVLNRPLNFPALLLNAVDQVPANCEAASA